MKINKRNPKVDVYFRVGCGRCPLVNTPECKVHNWAEELAKLREIVLDCELDEELKWSHPVYTFQQNNIVMTGAFKENCVLSFFKGVLLKDESKILQKPGENTQAGRVIRFTDVRQIIGLQSVIKAYIYEAVEIEKNGLKVVFRETNDFTLPKELETKFTEKPALRSAFFALTQGRQKDYILHFSQPKQSKTRSERIEKCTPQIMSGKGLRDNYAMKKH